MPQIYSPSIFSRKKVQSMPFSGILMGRTAAYKSRDRRSMLLAEIRLGHGSPALGVTIGPFNSTSHCFTCSSTHSGRLCRRAARFSMVMPSMWRISIFPLSISGFIRVSSTRRACFMMMGPMPSPGITPITILSSLEKSLGSPPAFIRSIRSSSDKISSPNCRFASSKNSITHPPSY